MRPSIASPADEPKANRPGRAADSPSAHPPANSWLLHAVVLAIGLYAAFRPTVNSGFGRMQADPGDTLLNHFILEHSWRCVSQADYVGTWWSPPCFAPEPLTLAYSENLFGTAPLYWLLRLGCADVLAFQLWMMLVAALTYAASAWTFTRLGILPALAALGGYLIAFSLPRLAQIGHQQLLPAMFTPLAILAAGRFLHAPSIAGLCGLLAATAAQMWTSIYLGWFLFLGLALFVLAFAIFDWQTPKRVGLFLLRRFPIVLLLFVAWAGALWLLFEPYLEANRGFYRTYSEAREFIPRASTWLASAPQGAWYPILPSESNPELWIFPGFATIGLVVCALVFRREPLVLTALLLALLALRVDAASAWSLVYKWVPGAQGIRVVSRIWVTILPFALMGGLVALDRKLNGKYVVASWILAIGIGEQVPWRLELPSFETAPWQERIDGVARQMKPGKLHYVKLTPGLTAYQGQLIAMWAGLRANVPVMNGYSGRYPNGYPDSSHTWSQIEIGGWLVGKRTGAVQVIEP